jgi:hypothetical protein
MMERTSERWGAGLVAGPKNPVAKLRRRHRAIGIARRGNRPDHQAGRRLSAAHDDARCGAANCASHQLPLGRSSQICQCRKPGQLPRAGTWRDDHRRQNKTHWGYCRRAHNGANQANAWERGPATSKHSWCKQRGVGGGRVPTIQMCCGHGPSPPNEASVSPSLR